MKELYNKKDVDAVLKLEGLSYDERSQAVILYKETPIISKVNNEDIGMSIGEPLSAIHNS